MEVVNGDRSAAEDRLDDSVLEWLGQAGDTDLLLVTVAHNVNEDEGVVNKNLHSEIAEIVGDDGDRSDSDAMLDTSTVSATKEQMWAIAALSGVQFIEDGAALEGFLGDPLEDEDETHIVSIDDVNWREALQDHEVFEVDGKQCPTLAGLRRLAKPFIEAEQSEVKVGTVTKEVRRALKRYGPKGDGSEKMVVIGIEEVIGYDNLPYAAVTFTVQLQDGRQFVDSADAFLGNCNEYGNYPVAVASARAEGRVLRKVLGIAEHVYEELSSKDAVEELTSSEDRPIAPEQKKFITSKIADLEDFSLKDLLGKVSARDITGVEELTGAEAEEAIRTLNTLKKTQAKNNKRKAK